MLLLTPKPLKPGRWYVNIVHPMDIGTVDFAVYASFSPDPPAAVDKLVRDAMVWTHLAGDTVQRIKILKRLIK